MNDNFCIISSNCWGAEVYKEYSKEYNTPFVGLFLNPECFVKFCNNPDHYLAQKLYFKKSSKYPIYSKTKYPIASLSDIEIHFMHYKSEEEAIDKWTRRILRMPKDKSLWRVVCSDREIINNKLFKEEWEKIDLKKIYFSSKKQEINNLIYISEEKLRKSVINGRALYNVSKHYVNLDLWLHEGIIENKSPFFPYFRGACDLLRS